MTDFLRDHEFRIRMIEHHRDEEVLSTIWDASCRWKITLTIWTETRILLLQENKWWPHLNKSGSDKHLKWTRFSRVKKCTRNMIIDEIDDHRIQFDYKCTIGLQYPEGKELYTWYCVCVVKTERTRTHDTNDKTWTKQDQSTFPQWNVKDVNWLHAWSHVRIVPVVRFWSSWSAHHIVASSFEFMRVSHGHPFMQWALLFDLWPLHLSQLPLLLILF